MTLSRKHAAVLLAALASAAAAAFTLHGQSQSSGRPTQAPMNLNLVVLDPAHGGSESGATIADKVLEKDVTLAVATKLRAALASAGFTVISTREADNPDSITTDQRAEIANRTHALACIVIHATATGSGMHVYTSTLPPPITDADSEAPSAFVPVPWEAAQAGFVRQSLSLATSLSSALGSSHLPASTGQAPLRPLDNMMCPAVAVEMAPLLAPGVGSTPASDANYQQQVATTLAAALRSWRDSLQPTAQAMPAAPATPQSKAIAAAQAVIHAAARTPAPDSLPRGTP